MSVDQEQERHNGRECGNRDAEVVVLGVGGHAKVIISTLQALGYHSIAAYDDGETLWGTSVLGVRVAGPLSAIGPARRLAVIGFGDNKLRHKMAESLDLNWLTLIHPNAVVHPSVRLGVGTVVFAGAVIQPDARLGRHVIVNTGATVDHDCVLGDFAHLAPGAHLAGGVKVGAGSFLGIGSAVTPNIVIGDWTTVGAGAVVVRNLPEKIVAYGIPARARREQKMMALPEEYSTEEHLTEEHLTEEYSAASAPELQNMETNSESVAEERNIEARIVEETNVQEQIVLEKNAISDDTGLTAEFIAPEDPRWQEFLDHVEHDFYHLPEYVKLEAEQSNARPAAFFAEQDEAQFLVPLLLCPSLPGERKSGESAGSDWCDAISPYGYPCPLLSPAADETHLDRFLDAFRETGADAGMVTAFLRLHPLLPLPQSPLERHGKLVRHGQTVSFDLGLSSEELKAGMRSNHRIGIKKLLKAGFEARMDEWQWFPQFIEAYHGTMRRAQAEQRYFFSEEYFARLRESLGEHLHLATVLSPEDEFAGGGLFVSTCGIVQSHLLGTSDDYHRYAPTKLLIDFVRRWAQERDEKYFHLGGGVGGREDDSLFLFKCGFSRNWTDFYTYRLIFDYHRYDQLVEHWRQSGGSADDDTEFFPLYRRPIG